MATLLSAARHILSALVVKQYTKELIADSRSQSGLLIIVLKVPISSQMIDMVATLTGSILFAGQRLLDNMLCKQLVIVRCIACWE